MGLLDGLVGGSSESPLESVVMSLLNNNAGGQGNGQGGLLGGLLGAASGSGGGGGLQNLLAAFEQNGMGHIAQSWIGHGPNQPVSPDQVRQVFGDDQVQSMASQTGLPKQDLLQQLAQLLPGMVDRMTPHGQVPAEN